ncbi:DUF6036 family nucleotidyltransferase [Terrarubrum flagellatum]|uniref:DUF6036 family nucleotidyltransferase n=1 Tax=Terrirubrum flagellatum TaxID=2895980 RepID=UPI0031456BB5
MITRRALEHVLRACASITGEKRFVVVGSSGIVAIVDNPPPEMLKTREIDLYAPDASDVERVSDLIDGSIGSGSLFESTFGYAADGVSPGTAVLPADWRTRATIFSSEDSGGATAVIPSINDIALSKLVAWREKDREWIAAAIAHGFADPDQIAGIAASLPPTDTPPEELQRRLAVIGNPPRPVL